MPYNFDDYYLLPELDEEGHNCEYCGSNDEVVDLVYNFYEHSGLALEARCRVCVDEDTKWVCPECGAMHGYFTTQCVQCL